MARLWFDAAPSACKSSGRWSSVFCMGHSVLQSSWTLAMQHWSSRRAEFVGEELSNEINKKEIKSPHLLQSRSKLQRLFGSLLGLVHIRSPNAASAQTELSCTQLASRSGIGLCRYRSRHGAPSIGPRYRPCRRFLPINTWVKEGRLLSLPGCTGPDLCQRNSLKKETHTHTKRCR